MAYATRKRAFGANWRSWVNVVTTVPTELQRVALTRLGADMAAL